MDLICVSMLPYIIEAFLDDPVDGEEYGVIRAENFFDLCLDLVLLVLIKLIDPFEKRGAEGLGIHFNGSQIVDHSADPVNGFTEFVPY